MSPTVGSSHESQLEEGGGNSGRSRQVQTHNKIKQQNKQTKNKNKQTRELWEEQAGADTQQNKATKQTNKK